jgi:hypothetical protein
VRDLGEAIAQAIDFVGLTQDSNQHGSEKFRVSQA